MSSTYYPLSSPEDSWLASALNCTPLQPDIITPIPVPFFPSLTLTSSPRRHASLTCSGLMVVGHRLDCYSCFPLFSQFSSVTLGHGSLAQDIPQSLTLIPDAHTSNSASCGTPSVESTTVVISQPLSRTALNVSLLRYIAFVFRLLVCLALPRGS